MLLSVKPLNSGYFEPFGEVLDVRTAESFPINNGTTTRFHALGEVEVSGKDAKAIISVFRGQPRPLPIEISMMERHPLGSQAFYPLSANPYLVVVAEDLDGRPGEPKAFIANSQQGVNYHQNVWHHPLLSLQRVSDFLIVDRAGSGNNLEEVEYFEPYMIERI